MDVLEEIPRPARLKPGLAKPTKPNVPTPKPLVDFADTPPDSAQTLLGDRFLCRKGGGLFVGQSGIGKSVGSAQQDLLWSIGKPAFGIEPVRPLRILTIQAEDDDGDLSEMASGIMRGLRFTDEEKNLSRENCHYVTCRDYTGPEFLTKIVRPLLAKGSYDFLRINPLQAYAGGDVKNTEVTTPFLRTGLNPILDEFQVGNLIVHHTPKVTFRDTKDWKAGDWMYSGAGAADITNWARAILVIESTKDPYIFKFIAASVELASVG
jgi:RecA-family ATPase